MEESIKIKEVRKRLYQNKEKFRYDLQYICKLFEVEDNEILKKYDSLSEEMINLHIEKDKIEKKINDVGYEFEKLKIDFLNKNKIDIKDKVLSIRNGKKVLEELWKGGFISNDMCDVIKDELWRKRKTQPYEFAKWM